MNRSLIAYAVAAAVALTTAGTPASAATGTSNAGTNVGSNAGTNTGSNAGTNVGSNQGTHVGSNVPTQIDANKPSNNNVPGVIGNAGTTGAPGDAGGGINGLVPDITGTTVTVPANPVPAQGTMTNTTPANPQNTTPANGTTPAPTGPITSNGALTTANVPPANNRLNPQVGVIANRHVQIEGRLVDLYSAAHEVTPTAAPAGKANTPASGAAAQRPARSTAAAEPVTEAIGAVRRTGTESTGTVGVQSPAAQNVTPMNTNKAEVSVIVPNDNGRRSFDSATITKELDAGLPATIMSGNQLYILATDPRPLAIYSGQNLRVSGQVNASGVLIPDKLEVRQDGNYREVALTKPAVATPTHATASER